MNPDTTASSRASVKHRKTAERASAATRPASAVGDDNRFSRASWLADILRERVIDGTYAPGDRIREAMLQQEFGFSNGPIREALQRLVADGLAQRAPWQGVRVIALGAQEIVDLFELRSALLEYAAERAADGLPARIDRIRASMIGAVRAPAVRCIARYTYTRDLSIVACHTADAVRPEEPAHENVPPFPCAVLADAWPGSASAGQRFEY